MSANKERGGVRLVPSPDGWLVVKIEIDPSGFLQQMKVAGPFPTETLAEFAAREMIEKPVFGDD